MFAELDPIFVGLPIEEPQDVQDLASQISRKMISPNISRNTQKYAAVTFIEDPAVLAVISSLTEVPEPIRTETLKASTLLICLNIFQANLESVCPLILKLEHLSWRAGKLLFTEFFRRKPSVTFQLYS